MVQIIAREAKAANVGLDVQVYPGASLFKPNEQWNAMVNGQLDISSFPLDYASGKQRAFGATLMPGLVRSHDRAQRLNGSPFMKEIKAKIEKAGVIVLSDAWLSGGMASKKACIRTPADVKGLKFRSAVASPRPVEQTWRALKAPRAGGAGRLDAAPIGSRIGA